MTEYEKIEKLIEIASTGKTVRILGIGNSMRPLLHGGRDYIYFQKDTHYQKGDIVLYFSQGKYIMHRIAQVTNSGYIMLGDGNQFKEEPIPQTDIYLKAVGFLRNNKYISAKHPLYRLYSSLWTNFWHLRPVVRRCKSMINRIVAPFNHRCRGEDK